MANLDSTIVEKEIIKSVDAVRKKFKIDAVVNGDCSPGGIGIASQVLLNVMRRLEGTLGIAIPHNCYIFHDKKTKRQLTIKEAVEKLIKNATDGN